MMSAEKPAPKVRSDLEAVPTIYEGERALLITDRLGMIETPLVVQKLALAVLGYLDGRRSPADIQADLMRRSGGVFVSRDAIDSVISELDARGVLDSPDFRRARAAMIDAYARREIREAFLAGQSYPESAADLRAFLDGMLGAAAPGPSPDAAGIRALAAPHIELRTGAKIYGAAYRAVRGLSPEKVVLLGTGHALDDGLFSLTEKDFETPLGTVPTDRAAVAALRDAGGGAIAPSDIAHRREHSLEFQAIFLRHLFGSGFAIVPILCGTFQGRLRKAARPMDVSEASGMLAVLKEMVEDWGPRVLCVAGVDLSHIGPKFGHEETAASLRSRAEAHDKALVEAACRGDVEALWAESRRVDDRFNVCGFSSLACLLEIAGPVEGVCLGHEFWHEDETRSAVSYAALLFRSPSRRAAG